MSQADSTQVSFRVDSVGELIGQLVGACSMVRFWDRMPDNYPHDAGIFQDDVANKLVTAAMAEYERLTDLTALNVVPRVDGTTAGDVEEPPLNWPRAVARFRDAAQTLVTAGIVEYQNRHAPEPAAKHDDPGHDDA